jgi:Kef-type K+ transport system membrane component KefB
MDAISQLLSGTTAIADALRSELGYVLLLFVLFVLPRFLQRYRLPQAITSVGLGAFFGLFLHLYHGDSTVGLLATLGIVSLFLFAGLEVDFAVLRREARVLIQHLAVGVAALFVGAYLVQRLFELNFRPSLLVSLALLTPSTGFILDSLHRFGLNERERFWVKSKAIATELVAFGALFFTLQSESTTRLGVSTGVLLLLVALLPVVFRWFARVVVPYAPKSEFAFLLMVATLAAMVTRRLGVYYLVGAFVVGLVAQSFRKRLPAMASDQMLHAMEVFASVFVPFYFFNAGLHLSRDDFSLEALEIGFGFLALVTPLRIGLVAAHRRLALREAWTPGVRIGLAMVPTLVFGLVIAEILRDEFGLSPHLFGGLIVYTLGNTLLPGLLLKEEGPPVAPTEAPDDSIRDHLETVVGME